MSIANAWEMETPFDNNEPFETHLRDLSEVFDCLSHYLLIGELHFYSLSVTFLTLLTDYLSNHKQQIKVRNVFSK